MDTKSLKTKSAGLFKNLQAELKSYQSTVSSVLTDFAKERENARQYASKFKDEDAIFADKMRECIPNVRNRLSSVNADFAGKIRVLHTEMENSLLDALCKPQGQAFLRLLDVYEQHGLLPSKTELNALVTLNEGNLVGFRLINNLLKLVESKYRIQCPEVETLEKTLEDLQHLAEELELMPTFSLARLREGREVFGRFGVKTTVADAHISSTCISEPAPVLRKDADGNIKTTGQKWDDIGLAINASIFDGLPDRINNIASPWTSLETYPKITVDASDQAKELAVELGRQKAEAGAPVRPKLADTGMVK